MKINPTHMKKKAEAAEGLLKSLSNRNRLMILCLLVDGERSVGELVMALEVNGPTVSQHLTLLRKDGLVKTRRDGQTIWYSISSEPARKVIETLYRIYCA